MRTTLVLELIAVVCSEPLVQVPALVRLAAQLTMLGIRRLRSPAVFLRWQMRLIAITALRRWA